MTTDEQRIFVCEKLFGIKTPKPDQIAEGYSFQDWVDDLPPLTLDWLHECEKRLPIDSQASYACRLISGRWLPETGKQVFRIAHATAEQRLAALVETIKSTSPDRAERKK